MIFNGGVRWIASLPCESSFRPLTGIVIFNTLGLCQMTNKGNYISFRPLTGIMIFNARNQWQRGYKAFDKSFRPLTGIVIFTTLLVKGSKSPLEFPSPYGDCDF